MKLKNFLIILLLLTIISCKKTDRFEKSFEDYFNDNNMSLNKDYLFDMRDITWIEWDIMRFKENESGSYCDFVLNDKIVYSYINKKPFSNPSGVEFGFGNLMLDNEYDSSNCIFKLHVERKTANNDFIFFVLPRKGNVLK